jgi:hypothetical protein
MPGTRRASIDLPAPGGPTSSRWWAARGGNLERATRDELAAHIGEILGAARDVGIGRRRGGARQLAVTQPVGDRRESIGREHLEPLDERGFRRAGERADEARDAGSPQTLGERKCAADRAQRAVERDLADRCGTREPLAGHLVRRSEHRDRDREIHRGALLSAVGGSEARGDVAIGHLEAAVPERGHTRSRASRAEASGSPTRMKPGSPGPTSTSHSTGNASRPHRAAVRTRLSIAMTPRGRARGRGGERSVSGRGGSSVARARGPRPARVDS